MDDLEKVAREALALARANEINNKHALERIDTHESECIAKHNTVIKQQEIIFDKLDKLSDKIGAERTYVTRLVLSGLGALISFLIAIILLLVKS